MKILRKLDQRLKMWRRRMIDYIENEVITKILNKSENYITPKVY